MAKKTYKYVHRWKKFEKLAKKHKLEFELVDERYNVYEVRGKKKRLKKFDKKASDLADSDISKVPITAGNGFFDTFEKFLDDINDAASSIFSTASQKPVIPNDPSDGMLTRTEYCKRYNVPRQTLDRWVSRGLVRHVGNYVFQGPEYPFKAKGDRAEPWTWVTWDIYKGLRKEWSNWNAIDEEEE